MRSATIEVAGRTVALRMDMNALARYQDRSGETITAALSAIKADGWDAIRGRRMFWAALTERMTEDEAGDLMTEIGMGRALELAGEAVSYALKSLIGEKDDGGNGDKPEKPEKATPPAT